MKIEDITKSVEIVNGEKLYLIDMKLWPDLERENAIEGIQLGGKTILKLLRGMASFVSRHNEFDLAFYRYNIGTTSYRWNFCILYNINGEWQRVQKESITCTFCGWKGEIANPTVASLYDTVKDWSVALKTAINLPEVNCPTCGKKLMRKAIWAGETLNN